MTDSAILETKVDPGPDPASGARASRLATPSAALLRGESRLSASALKWILLATDVALLLGMGAAVLLLNGAVGEMEGWARLGAYAATAVVLIYIVGGYVGSAYHTGSAHLLGIAAALACAAAALAAMNFVALPTAAMKWIQVQAVVAGSVAVLAWRSVGASMVRSRLSRLRIVVIGDGEASTALLRELREHPEYELAAVLDHDCDSGELGRTVTEGAPDVIAVATTREKSQGLLEHLVECRYAGVRVLDTPGSFEALAQRLPIRHLDPAWVAFSSRFEGTVSSPDAKLKRLVDIGAALTGLLLFAPVMLLIAGVILSTSGRPLLYRQERVGRYGRSFQIVKFRTMRPDAEALGHAKWAGEEDRRVTRVGRFLRRSHLDELPQLWNILRGDMALVGPRPERPEFVTRLRGVIPYYDLRHMAKPGLTGWAQIRYPYGASVGDAARKLEYDLYYLRHRNVLWDLRIVLRTIMVALGGTGSR